MAIVTRLFFDSTSITFLSLVIQGYSPKVQNHTIELEISVLFSFLEIQKPEQGAILSVNSVIVL